MMKYTLFFLDILAGDVAALIEINCGRLVA
jgi:hypothetical protein